jgi:hypothetical protein
MSLVEMSTSILTPINESLTVPLQVQEGDLGSQIPIEFLETTTGTFLKSANILPEDPETTQRGFKDNDASVNIIVDNLPTYINKDTKLDDGETTIRVSVTQTIQETTSRQIVPLAEFIHKYQAKGQLASENQSGLKALHKDPSEIVQVHFLFVQ